MKNLRLKGIAAVCGVLLFSLISICYASDLMIIANADVLEDRLESKAVKDIFLGDIVKWKNGQMITIVLSPESASFNSFLADYINRSATQFRNVWRQNLFTGKGKQPVKVKSVEELVNYVAETSGAIGYVSSGIPLPGTVKVLLK